MLRLEEVHHRDSSSVDVEPKGVKGVFHHVTSFVKNSSKPSSASKQASINEPSDSLTESNEKQRDDVNVFEDQSQCGDSMRDDDYSDEESSQRDGYKKELTDSSSVEEHASHTEEDVSLGDAVRKSESEKGILLGFAADAPSRQKLDAGVGGEDEDKAKDEQIELLKDMLAQAEKRLKATEEKYHFSSEQLKETSERAEYFSCQATEYKERLEDWLTEANEERGGLQQSLQDAKNKVKEKEETISNLRKSLVDSLALLRPLRHQVSFSESDIKGLKRRVASSDLIIYDLQERLSKALGEKTNDLGTATCRSEPSKASESSHTDESEKLQEGLTVKLEQVLLKKDQDLKKLRDILRKTSDRLVEKDVELLELSSTSNEASIDKEVSLERKAPTSDAENSVKLLEDAQERIVSLQVKAMESERVIGELRLQLQENRETEATRQEQMKAKAARSEIDLMQKNEELMSSLQTLQQEKREMLQQIYAMQEAAIEPSNSARLGGKPLKKIVITQPPEEDEDERDRREEELRGLCEEKDDLIQENAELMEVIRELERDQKRKNEERKKELEKVQNENEKLKMRMDEMEGENRELAQQQMNSQAHDKDVETLEKEIENLKEKLSITESSYNEAMNELFSENEAKSTLEHELNKLANQEGELSKAFEELQIEQMKLKAEKQKAKEQAKKSKKFRQDASGSSTTGEKLQQSDGEGSSLKTHETESKSKSKSKSTPNGDDSTTSSKKAPESFHAQLKSLEARLFEVGCLYQVTRRKLHAEKEAKRVLEQDLQTMLQGAEETAEEMDCLRKALKKKEKELFCAKRVATAAFVQVDELSRNSDTAVEI